MEAELFNLDCDVSLKKFLITLIVGSEVLALCLPGEDFNCMNV